MVEAAAIMVVRAILIPATLVVTAEVAIDP
jgi:hypothetical protein